MKKESIHGSERTGLECNQTRNIINIVIPGLLAVTLSVFASGIANANSAEIAPQPKKIADKSMSNKCNIVPIKGHCKGNFTTYFYDMKAKKCETAIGCVTSVFDSMAECEKTCLNLTAAEDNTLPPSEGLFMYLNKGGGDPERVRKFIKRGADVNYKDDKYMITPLHNAAHYGHLQVVMILLESGAQIDARNREGNTALYTAIHERHPGIASSLVQKGADVNVRNNFGYTPVREACRWGNPYVLKYLITNGADVNAKDRKNDTPLHIAIDGNFIELVRTLLNSGARVNATGSFGDAPIHTAVKRGFTDIAGLLIEAGADLSIKNEKGLTPIDIAELPFSAADKELKELLKKKNRVKL